MKRFILLMDLFRDREWSATIIDAPSVDSDKFRDAFYDAVCGYHGESGGDWLSNLEDDEDCDGCFQIFEISEQCSTNGLTNYAKERSDMDDAQWKAHREQQDKDNRREAYERLRKEFGEK